jgi:hypothetical protein
MSVHFVTAILSICFNALLRVSCCHWGCPSLKGRPHCKALFCPSSLRSMSTGDFQDALSALFGKDAPKLSPSVIARLTADWQAEYERWQRRDLSARRYVYVCAVEDHSECMLVLIGATISPRKRSQTQNFID